MAKKKRKGSDKHKKGPPKKPKGALSLADCELCRELRAVSAANPCNNPCNNPSLLFVPSQRLARLKASNDRSVGIAGTRPDVIKVPEGAVLRKCKKTRRKLKEHLQLRAEVHSQLRVIASLFVIRISLTCLVGYPTPWYRSATEPPAVQPPQAPDAPPLPPLPPRAPAQPAPAQPASMECDTNSDSESYCDSEPEPQSDLESESEPELVMQPPPRRCSARLAALAPATPTGPPLPLDCEDPVMLKQLKDFSQFYANPQSTTSCSGAFNQALLAKLQELGNINLRERFVKLYAKAARARLGWSGEEAQLFIKMACGYGITAQSSELQAATLDKGHVADLIEEADTHRRLLGMKKQGSLQDTLPLPCRMRHAVHVCRWLEQWQQPPTPLCQGSQSAARGVGVGVHFVKVDGSVLHGVCKQLGLTKETQAAFTSEPALSHNWARWFNKRKLRNKGFHNKDCGDRWCQRTQIGVGIDPGVTQAVSAASGVWDETTGQLVANQLAQWKLTKGHQGKLTKGLNNARRTTQRWLAPIKPHLQHLAAASSAGTSLEANLKHITVTLATWDAVWEVYLDPKWARQRLRLFGAQDRALEQFFKKV
ncbi:hypothetical protein QJQ45_003800 [Haematococcus lacustris]|nr:hypothetical protein QJQ45_003800 [Haematococcus lacustris]